MATAAPRIASLLSRPGVYWSFQRLLGASAVHRHVISEHARVRPGERVLDIGCGPGRALDVLPDVDYLGLDHSPAYIESARRRYGGRAEFRCADVASDGIGREAPFDVVLVLGVLHHLDDEQGRQMVGNAARALSSSGRMVTLDPSVTAESPALARWLVRRDRGVHPRSPETYRSIVGEAFGSVTATVHQGLAHVPYTHVVLDCRTPRAPAATGS